MKFRNYDLDILLRLFLVSLSVAATIILLRVQKNKSDQVLLEVEKRKEIFSNQDKLIEKIDEIFQIWDQKKGIPKTMSMLTSQKKMISLETNTICQSTDPQFTPLIWESSQNYSLKGILIGFLNRQVGFFAITPEELEKEIKKLNDLRQKNTVQSYQFPYQAYYLMEINGVDYSRLFKEKSKDQKN